MKYFVLFIVVVGLIVLLNSAWWKRQVKYVTLGRQLRLNKDAIEKSKKLLEENIMEMPYVTSVSTRPYENNEDVVREGVETYIQVGVDSHEHIQEIKDVILCPDNGRWQGFDTKIVVEQTPIIQD